MPRTTDMALLRPGLAAAAAILLLGTVAAPAAAASGTNNTGGERLAAPGVVVAPGVPAPPTVAAQAYVVADATTGQVLAAKNAHQKLRPASTLKALTALTVLPHLEADQVYTARHEDAAVEGSKAGVVPGGTYTVDDLFNALFLRSGNDATTALAHAAGGVPATLEEMNAKARDLGALDTTAVNPTGLDEDGQYSSAYDLALFGRAALRVPELRAYMGKTNAVFPGRMPAAGKPRDTFELWTQQKYVLNYDGAVGVKNGYTTLARFTAIAAAQRDGRTVLVTVMKTSADYWREAAALSDWAFGPGARAPAVGALVEPAVRAQPAAGARRGARQAPAALLPVPENEGRTPLGLAGRAAAVLALAVVVLRARVLLRRRHRRTPVDVDAHLPQPRRRAVRAGAPRDPARSGVRRRPAP